MWILNSPDAAAVQVAARTFAETGSLVWEPAGDWPAEVGAPRSFTRVEHGWAPGSYVGLPAIYGVLWVLGGPLLALWVTPLLGALGVWLMYLLVRRWRNPQAALAAGALLAVSPAYWYASQQPFTPALPLVVLLLAAAFCFTGRRSSSFLLGGLALGAAIAIRPHEAIWIVPLALVVLLGQRSWRQAGLAAIGAATPLLVVAYLQLQTYGSILGSGYSLASAGDGGPFSFGLRVIAANVWRYVLQLHGFILGLAAIGVAFGSGVRTAGRRYLWAVAIVAVGWAAIYGSYLVHDSPGIAEPTIGNSQVRYLLPLLVLLVPLAANLLGRTSPVAAISAVALAASLGYGSVVAANGDGTLAVQRTLTENRALQAAVLAATDEQTLVVAGRLDKLFVGHRPTSFAAPDGVADALRSGRRAVGVGGGSFYEVTAQ